VLVHGFSANRYENWKRMGWYDAIASKGLRGFALDNRGHGESAKPHDPPSTVAKRWHAMYLHSWTMPASSAPICWCFSPWARTLR